MAMQRSLNPDGTVRLVDLGPLTAHPLPGYTLRGHAVVGRSGGSRNDRDKANEYMRRYLAKKAAKP